MKSFLDACRMPEPLQLAVEAEGTHEAGVRLLHQPFALIGRDQRADVPLDHRLVSRRHVYLQVVEGHVVWIDLESRLGTLGSGRPRKFGWLDVDETMRIGPYEIRRLVGGRPIYNEGANHPLPDTVPLVAKSYGPSPWPEVSLEFLNGPSRSAVWPMNRVMSLVGSASGCKFRLADPSVSPFHCSLLRTSVGLWIVDLLGNDGVAVNNAPVRYALLADGDLVKIGRYRIRVRSRFFEAFDPDQPNAIPVSPRRPQTHVLPLRAPSTTHTSAPNDSSGELPALGEPSWSPETTLAPRAFMPGIARTEVMPPAGTDFYPPGVGQQGVEASVLVPLVNQFGMMQQQMLDQFQNAMGMLVEMFGSLQREQMDVIRHELDHLREVTREVQEVKLELAAYTQARARADAAVGESTAEAKAGTASPAPPAAPAMLPRSAEAKTPDAVPSSVPAAPAIPSPASAHESPPRGVAPVTEGAAAFATKATASQASSLSAAGPGKRPGEGPGNENERDVMLWLNQRIATLQTERETRWQKILKLLPGAS
jgi:pSer/pThr/pTyr-binding forkhead associated (FHA) protein